MFRNNNSAAAFVVMIDEARTGWFATRKCAQRMRTAWKSKTSGTLPVVRNWLTRTALSSTWRIHNQCFLFGTTSCSFTKQLTIMAPTYVSYYLRIKSVLPIIYLFQCGADICIEEYIWINLNKYIHSSKYLLFFSLANKSDIYSWSIYTDK